MIRRCSSGRLGRKRRKEEDPSPMWGVSNMADVMLVLAVGIMLALVANWNISISNGTVKELDIKSGAVKQLEDFTTLEDEDFAEKIKQSGLEELGSVYVEPETGNMYVIVSEDEGVSDKK